MTKPMGTPRSTSTASESCRLASIGFRHRVGDAELVERARVLRVARAGDQRDVGPQPSRRLDDSFVGERRVHRHHERARGLDAAAAQEIGARGVAEIGGAPVAARARDQIGVGIDRDERDLVDVQHVADQRADAPEADEDHAMAVVAPAAPSSPRPVGCARAGASPRAATTRPSNGSVTIESAAATSAIRPLAGSTTPPAIARADQHEGEFAARRRASIATSRAVAG